MLSCGALQRSNNPYIESIMCFSELERDPRDVDLIACVCVCARACMRGCVCVCKTSTALLMFALQSFSRHIKNVNLLVKRILKAQDLLSKHPFSFTLETVLKL